MKILNELSLKIDKKKKTIYFGMPDSEKEIKEMFNLRYLVYKSKNYLKNKLTVNLSDKDIYDLEKKCFYFIATLDDKIIGTVRLIKTDPLPTESECFNFKEPLQMGKISRIQRAELSRLISIPYDVDKYLPRNIVLLFLMKSVFDFCLKNNISGGYSFITKKLYIKIKKLKVPFHLINNYVLIYSKDGLLSPYFSQKDNPIYPIYFLINEFDHYLKEVFENRKIFKKESNKKFFLKSNIYNSFLRFLGII